MLFVAGVVALNLYAIALVLLRAAVYRTRLYRPMLWNVWLSVLPILILILGMLLAALVGQIDGRLAPPALVLSGIVWLLLLPNAGYLITELNLSHRDEDDPVPLWYDLILGITLAMSGVVNTVVNVLLVHVFVSLAVFGDEVAAVNRPESWIAVAAVLLLLGFGMYLGRYLRLNSWDVRHPVAFARKAAAHFRIRGNLLACVGFSLTYALFIGLIYVIIAGLVLGTFEALEAVRASA
ncbi:DUF1361 domain-containing protein [Leucobacter soli]|uniref:DUF1361 domain-containing protein n=1 Tax=Leucobacter soli TaxID=2812850 RepID=A0A916JUJ1_9MICO|nr:DUF1361 domain-containing protein [Leucobacter soli]CAG7601779.1 hypothetical protein LEUCIP111803_00504 [Leucobacter soli]